jgi:hypothetical protein
VRVKGTARVTALDLATRDASFGAAWKELAVDLTSLTLPLGEPAGGGLEVGLAKISLADPHIEVLRAAAPAPAQAEPPAPEAAAPPAEPAPAAPSPPPRIRVDVLDVSGGTLRFRDTVVKPKVETSLRDVRIQAKGLRWPERDAESLRVSAKGQQGARLRIQGKLAAGSGALDLDLSELGLPNFDPYAAAATGIQIDGGRASLKAKFVFGKDSIGAKSTLGLHELALSERESGWFQKAFGIPLDVAVALLRDLKGDITLPIDVEQSAGETRVGIAAAIAAALRQALMGALASPLKMLGSVAGAAGEMLSSGLEPIPMAPGSAEPAAETSARIEALAKLLASRPGLRVELRGRADATDDPELARREVVARAHAGEKLAGEDELGFFERRRVRAALAEADPDELGSLEPEAAAGLQKLAAAIAVSDDARRELALARARAVQRALVEEHGAAPASIAGVEAEVGAPAVVIELRAQ